MRKKAELPHERRRLVGDGQAGREESLKMLIVVEKHSSSPAQAAKAVIFVSKQD